MDGLSVTCRTCGVKTSFEAAGNHICRARPLQQYSNGFGERGPSRSNDLGQRGESRSDISPPISIILLCDLRLISRSWPVSSSKRDSRLQFRTGCPSSSR